MIRDIVMAAAGVSTGPAPISVPWTFRDSAAAPATVQGFYTGSQFVALGCDWAGSNTIRSSADGITWSAKTCPIAGFSYATPVCWSGSQYVIGGSDGSLNASLLYTSTDLTTWTLRSSFTSAMSDAPSAIVYNGSSLYVAVSSYWNTNMQVATSSDAITWTGNSSLSAASYLFPANNPSAGPGVLGGITLLYFNGMFMVFASGGNYATSTNGTTWTQQTGLTSLASAGSYVVAYCVFGTKLVVSFPGGGLYYTTDGVNWAANNSAGLNTVTGLVSNGTYLYAHAASGGGLKLTTDITTSTWAPATPAGSLLAMYCMAYNGTRISAMGGGFNSDNNLPLPLGNWSAYTSP